MTTLHANTDRREISKFDALASRWWDPQGEFRTLHQINPLRLDYIERRTGLKNHKVLDVGCGGGLLAEAMAARGAAVTGIDMAEESLAVARLHLHESGLQVDYRKTSAESLAAEAPAQFDVVTCMEMLEHVPDPESIVRACATLVSPGGQVFFSTLNRKPKAFLLAILAAEYALRLVPRGIHEYARFIRPSELDQWARCAGLELLGSAGLHYNPLTRVYHLGGNLDVNYFLHFRRPD
ncbi:MAG: bifunctional 2-polyprenyl-6-hydroxyphenol methylase/3-demethylubiquinol 3-O-methyltransferase UbiG [Gammaproteobacteria bacterium]|nr:bifunctional 2-polyprenyl-6-hydroxyphenol methylase/3-demethylubiquinol 3-O-methyltransferase UbiG [Gammaproteobacteria bacterium]MBU6508680.1 bifunctional 2-polyprenyl-6-hydroxyphenol methylase/3-demethylubiquinol 3-O-methyltransferase UbiG [Gammaproteobacteria bacterium]MDE1982965.1 bifunctional 2-polyprenyl-6-hydroxyphenol methylase/3-demethylubiquinol 3-O-methyltransferase UbiG [Gammaproteobacteria bacterium]MDE2107785.1 bifunctional 2-polyprenyl-6-hydroxyphenol methylase/3-demethylubiqui